MQATFLESFRSVLELFLGLLGVVFVTLGGLLS